MSGQKLSMNKEDNPANTNNILTIIIDISHIVESTFARALDFLRNNSIEIDVMSQSFTNADKPGNEDMQSKREQYKDIVFNICSSVVNDIATKKPVQTTSLHTQFASYFKQFYLNCDIIAHTDLLDELGLLLENHVVIMFFQELCIHIPNIDDDYSFTILEMQRHYHFANTYSLIFYMRLQENATT